MKAHTPGQRRRRESSLILPAVFSFDIITSKDKVISSRPRVQIPRLGFSGIKARNRCCSTGVGGGRVLPSEMDNVFTTFSRRTGEFSSSVMSSCVSVVFLRKCFLLIFESRKLGYLFLCIRRNTEMTSDATTRTMRPVCHDRRLSKFAPLQVLLSPTQLSYLHA
ncbi:hypothetical protein ARMGADRAFT_527835 [Armillaria gallica]|uniref:Uncharacterized protein n=1 Tax=Armillaria gallica TaxID=47427 RepID=A0A2H3DXX4_ARMGA|nr:hypothetical protein ARMGADRAFT_527835 [Armillaria gallica]